MDLLRFAHRPAREKSRSGWKCGGGALSIGQRVQSLIQQSWQSFESFEKKKIAQPDQRKKKTAILRLRTTVGRHEFFYHLCQMPNPSENGAFGGVLKYQSRALMNDIDALRKGIQRASCPGTL